MDFLKKYYLPESYQRLDLKLLATFLLLTLCMLLIEYFGWQGPFYKNYQRFSLTSNLSRNDVFFYAQVFTSSSFITYMIIFPLVLHLFSPVQTENFYGLTGFKNFPMLFKPYIPLLIIMLPVLWIAAQTASFNQFYPLYRPQNVQDFLLYECIYLTQFIAVEFFFRGFFLFRLEKFLPGKAVFIMVLPYALIHIHKPFPEAMGSIFAGLILGMLALKSKSIWPGILTHATVAFSTDFFCLLHARNSFLN